VGFGQCHQTRSKGFCFSDLTVTVVPEFRPVRSRVSPAGTVMPLRTMFEQAVLLELAAAASVKVQADAPPEEVLVAAAEEDAALAVVLAEEEALLLVAALVEEVEALDEEVLAAVLAVVLLVVVFLLEAAKAAAAFVVLELAAAEVETDLQPGAAVTRALEPRRARTATARILRFDIVRECI
jgi:hypothetical protein